MFSKLGFVLASAALIQLVSSECLNPGNSAALLLPTASVNGLVPNIYQQGYAYQTPQTHGGAFVVHSASPITATGLSVLAENLLVEGALAVEGQLPLVGAVSVDGQVPAAGYAAANYACGNGNVGISEIAGNVAPGPNVATGVLSNAGANVYNKPEGAYGLLNSLGSNLIGPGSIGVGSNYANLGVPSASLAAAQAAANNIVNMPVRSIY